MDLIIRYLIVFVGLMLAFGLVVKFVRGALQLIALGILGLLTVFALRAAIIQGPAILAQINPQQSSSPPPTTSQPPQAVPQTTQIPTPSPQVSSPGPEEVLLPGQTGIDRAVTSVAVPLTTATNGQPQSQSPRQRRPVTGGW